MHKIVFITNTLGIGGAAKMLCFVAESLAKRGYETTILCLYKRSFVRELFSEANIIFLDCSDNKIKKWPDRFMKAYYQVKKIKPDVIVGFKLISNVVARVVSLMTKIPCVISERGDPYREFGDNLLSKIELSLINNSAGAVFQIEGAKAFYSDKLKKRGVVIPNPIFLEKGVENINRKRNKTIVTVGRFANKQKRYDVMFKAFEIFASNHPEYTLRIFGDGPDLSLIKDLASNTDVSENIIFEGLTVTPMQSIQNDGIFLITSDFEGISNSMLEAMAVGLPTVATDCSPGGARMVITNHVDGIVVPCNDINAIADALSQFADNPELAESCGQRARDVVQRFAPERITDMWESYLKSIASDM